MLTELYCGLPLGSYTLTRGWSGEDVDGAAEALAGEGLVADGELTPAGRQVREEIERETDDMQDPIVDALGGGLDDLVVGLSVLAEAVIAARGFPADPFKRAAG